MKHLLGIAFWLFVAFLAWLAVGWLEGLLLCLILLATGAAGPS